ncbi:14273_t:CDS:1, partial [Ambispora leptoticha]
DIVTSEQSLKINNMVNITMNHLEYFYLCVSVPLDIIDNQDNVWGKVISLDPGVCTFMTGYDPNSQLIEWGNGNLNKIFKLSKKYNKLQSDKDFVLG